MAVIPVIAQSLSHVRLFVIPWTAACQASLSFISQTLLKFMFIGLVMLSNHLILCCPLLLLPSMFPRIRVFSNESALCIRCSKYWSFCISPSNEYSGLISFRIDWFDLLAVIQGTLRSLKGHINKLCLYMSWPQSLLKESLTETSWSSQKVAGTIMLCEPHPSHVPKLALRAFQHK